MDSYLSCDPNDRNCMLQNIELDLGDKIVKIGKSISERIYKVFSSMDPLMLIN